MHITSLSSVASTIPKMEGASGVSKQVPISREHGTPAYSFRVFTLEPGGHTPYHEHPFAPLNYIIEGHGIAVGKDREYKVNKGDFALVMPGEVHQYKNTSDSEPLVFICAVPKEYE